MLLSVMLLCDKLAYTTLTAQVNEFGKQFESLWSKF